MTDKIGFSYTINGISSISNMLPYIYGYVVLTIIGEKFSANNILELLLPRGH